MLCVAVGEGESSKLALDFVAVRVAKVLSVIEMSAFNEENDKLD